ncbi:MAG TPA: hypothetical protein VGT08_01730 [Terracidiphilus sp.]|nr:hypothetical protein [Terracidiphilus sp.]
MGIQVQGAAGAIFGPSGANHSQGLVPDPGLTPITPLRFLREDAAWASIGSVVIPTSQVQGTTTNDNAAAGFIGEYISASVASPGTNISNSATVNLMSVVLTAGDWDTRLHVNWKGSGLTQSFHAISLSQTSGALDSTDPGAGLFNSNGEGFGGGNSTNSQVLGPYRQSLAATATVYGVVQMIFSAGSATAWGLLSARRVR